MLFHNAVSLPPLLFNASTEKGIPKGMCSTFGVRKLLQS